MYSLKRGTFQPVSQVLNYLSIREISALMYLFYLHFEEGISFWFAIEW